MSNWHHRFSSLTHLILRAHLHGHTAHRREDVVKSSTKSYPTFPEHCLHRYQKAISIYSQSRNGVSNSIKARLAAKLSVSQHAFLYHNKPILLPWRLRTKRRKRNSRCSSKHHWPPSLQCPSQQQQRKGNPHLPLSLLSLKNFFTTHLNWKMVCLFGISCPIVKIFE